MKLEINSFADAGNYQKERLVIKVLSDLDIGEFAVLCSSTTDEGSPTSGRKAAYWFPDKAVREGDLVVVYTKSGTTSTKDLQTGRTAHFFYWGLDQPIWGTSTNAAVVLEVAEWIHKRP